MQFPSFAPIPLLLIVACGEYTPASPSPGAGAALGPSIIGEVPMKGHYEGTGVFTAPPASCPGFYSVFHGTGRESHTGRYSLDHTTCTLPIDAVHSSFTGEFTKTTANGDLLFGTYEGAVELTEPPGAGSPIGVFGIRGTITFRGGTGRFEGAEGSQVMTGTQWTDISRPGFPSRMVLEFDGTISTVGSLRRGDIS